MITEPLYEVYGESKDSLTNYPTCNGGSPGESFYYKLKAGPKAYKEGSYSYEPSETQRWKIPSLGPKYPMTDKPYEVGRRVVQRRHGYVHGHYEKKTAQFILVRTGHDKGNPNTWTDDRCFYNVQPVETLSYWHDKRLVPPPAHEFAQYEFQKIWQPVAERMQSEVAARLYEKAEGDFDLLTELAEANKTLETVVDLLRVFTKKGLKRVARDLKKGSKTKAAANAHLKYQYGIKPIWYAAQDAASAVDNWKRKKYRTKREIRVKQGRWTATITVTGTVKVSNLTGRLTVNPIKTAWELLPYSFVIDWLINVGDLLGAWGTSLNPLVSITGSVGTKVDLSGSVSDQGVVPANREVKTTLRNPYSKGPRTHEYVALSESYTSVPAETQVEVVYFRRTVLVPDMISLFNKASQLGVYHAVTGAALARQRLK